MLIYFDKLALYIYYQLSIVYLILSNYFLQWQHYNNNTIVPPINNDKQPNSIDTQTFS